MHRLIRTPTYSCTDTYPTVRTWVSCALTRTRLRVHFMVSQQSQLSISLHVVHTRSHTGAMRRPARHTSQLKSAHFFWRNMAECEQEQENWEWRRQRSQSLRKRNTENVSVAFASLKHDLNKNVKGDKANHKTQINLSSPSSATRQPLLFVPLPSTDALSPSSLSSSSSLAPLLLRSLLSRDIRRFFQRIYFAFYHFFFCMPFSRARKMNKNAK